MKKNVQDPYEQDEIIVEVNCISETRFPHTSLNVENIQKKYKNLLTQRAILSNYKKVYKKKYFSYGKDEVRTLKIINRITNFSKMENGKALVSFYLYTYCRRENSVQTKRTEPVFNSFNPNVSPANIDYDTNILSEKFDGVGYKSECIVSVENKRSNSHAEIDCVKCDSSGYVICPTCNASGQEKYYDKREKMVKKMRCSSCYGHGKIECSNCNGSGVVEIFGSEYSVVKSVDQTICQAVAVVIVSPWGEKEVLHLSSPYLSNNYYENPYKMLSSEERQLYYLVRKSMHSEKNLSLLKKNLNEVLIDNRQSIIETINDRYPQLVDSYKKGVEVINEEMEKFQLGDIVAKQERHFAIPMSHLKCELNDKYGDLLKWYTYPINDKSSGIYLLNKDIPKTSVWRYLAYSLGVKF